MGRITATTDPIMAITLAIRTIITLICMGTTGVATITTIIGVVDSTGGVQPGVRPKYCRGGGPRPQPSPQPYCLPGDGQTR
jgi:hypothetical protein